MGQGNDRQKRLTLTFLLDDGDELERRVLEAYEQIPDRSNKRAEFLRRLLVAGYANLYGKFNHEPHSGPSEVKES